jgi:hypothetical protein
MGHPLGGETHAANRDVPQVVLRSADEGQYAPFAGGDLSSEPGLVLRIYPTSGRRLHPWRRKAIGARILLIAVYKKSVSEDISHGAKPDLARLARILDEEG